MTDEQIEQTFRCPVCGHDFSIDPGEPKPYASDWRMTFSHAQDGEHRVYIESSTHTESSGPTS